MGNLNVKVYLQHIMVLLFSLKVLNSAPNHALWLSILLLSMLLAYGVLSRFQPSLNIFNGQVFINQLLGSKNKQDDSKALSLFAALQIAIFTFLILPNINQYLGLNFILFIVVLMAVLVLYLLQTLLLYFLSYLMENLKVAKQYELFKSNATQAMAFPFIIVNLCFYAGNYLMSKIALGIGFLLLILMGILFFYRLIKISIKQNLAPWYIILYFCSLEIVPIVLVAKLLLSYQAKV